MTIAHLIADAAAAEREATAIWARINGASETLSACTVRGRPIVPAGMDADAQRAGDLMRHAERLRAEADDLQSQFESAPAASLSAAPPSPSSDRCQASPSAPVQAAARNPSEDEIAATAARIAASDSTPAATPKDDVAAAVARIMEA